MRDQRGMSLAELLMALLILSIVITTSMAAFFERNRRQQQAREIVSAYQVLANEAEHWRRIDFDALEANARGGFRSSTDLLAPLGSYAAIVAVAPQRPGVKNVTLTIRWRNGERQARLGLIRVDTGGTGLW